jgi:hypothetical protein
MKESIDIYYDEEGDYLEVSFGAPPEKEYTEDLSFDEVLITRDESTNAVKSIGIVSFKKRSKEAILEKALKKLRMSMPLVISIPSD